MVMPTALRGLGSGFACLLIAGAAVLVVPAVAHAESPTVHGDCAATVHGGDGDPITVDAGAPTGNPGLLDVGLGSDSTRTDGGEPLVRLGLPDALNALGADAVPSVSAAAAEGCEVVAGTANTAGATTQALLATEPREPQPPAEEPEQPAEEPAGTDEAHEAEAPVTEPGPERVDEPAAEQESPAAEEAEPLVAVAGATQPVEIEPSELGFIAPEQQAPLPRAPGLGPAQKEPADAETNAGRAHALPLAEERALSEVPFLLAVALIGGVATVLARRWRTQRAAG